MTTISRDDIVRLAQLSSLSLDDEEVTNLQADIANILSYVEQLNELDTEGVAAAYQVTGLTNILRADRVAQTTVSREELLELAPDATSNQVKVPKVL